MIKSKNNNKASCSPFICSKSKVKENKQDDPYKKIFQLEDELKYQKKQIDSCIQNFSKLSSEKKQKQNSKIESLKNQIQKLQIMNEELKAHPTQIPVPVEIIKEIQVPDPYQSKHIEMLTEEIERLNEVLQQLVNENQTLRKKTEFY